MPRLGQRRVRRKTALLILLAILVLIMAWYQGGERAVRPIEEDIAVPAGAL